VVVTNYLWRPLWPQILDSVAPGGVLLYETFGQGNEAGKPSRPDFLLAPGELLQVCTGWQVVAYECGQLRQPDRVVQRIAAIRPAGSALPARLTPPGHPAPPVQRLQHGRPAVALPARPGLPRTAAGTLESPARARARRTPWQGLPATPARLRGCMCDL
jgi:hypothetical protein